MVGKESVSSESDADDTIGVIARVSFRPVLCEDDSLDDVGSGLLLRC